jgi:hypothetical protein
MLSKKVRTRLLALALGGGGFLVVAEITLRFLPVSTPMRPRTVNEASPVFRYEPSRSFTFSRDWNFNVANRGWINNEGFVNDQDYDPDSPLPLLAVIGDSFIEAAMVPYSETAQGRLARDLEGRGRVYSFAASGAPLSQYLVWAEHARERFAPEALVISVVGNDFDESVARFGLYPGLHHFTPDESGAMGLVRVDFAPSSLGPLVYSSAFGRYLLLNLKARTHFAKLFRSDPASQVEWFVGNTMAEYTPERLAETLAAVEAFFELLPGKSGLAPERVLFVVDGMRPELYDPPQLERAGTSFFGVVRARFIEQARARGHEVVDLQPAFMERFARDQERFEFPTDYHWNGAGHAVVADAVRSSKVFADFEARLGD